MIPYGKCYSVVVRWISINSYTRSFTFFLHYHLSFLLVLWLGSGSEWLDNNTDRHYRLSLLFVFLPELSEFIIDWSGRQLQSFNDLSGIFTLRCRYERVCIAMSTCPTCPPTSNNINFTITAAATTTKFDVNVKNIYRRRRMSRVRIGGAGGRRNVRLSRMP